MLGFAKQLTKMLGFAKQLTKLFAPPGLTRWPQNRPTFDRGAELMSLVPCRVDYVIDEGVIAALRNPAIDIKYHPAEVERELTRDGVRGIHRLSMGGAVSLAITAESAWRFPEDAPTSESSEWRMDLLKDFRPDVLPLLLPFATAIL